jgi:predicted DCC family thiol-disulfide oxidoreductase YuxK
MHGVRPGSLDSMLLVENGMLFRKSTAALRIARMLRFPWSLGYSLIVVPQFLRDALYDFVGRRRYRWFGTRQFCSVAEDGTEHRFLG